MTNATQLQVIRVRAPAKGIIAPSNFEELKEFARYFSSSNMVPAVYKGKPYDCLIAMQMGSELGISPMQSIQNIAVINGKPALWGDALLAVVQAHPDYISHKESTFEEIDAEGKAVCSVKRKGFDEPVIATFSIADAKKAGLWGKKGPWTTYPARMLLMRARAFALRNSFADALKGISSREEVGDYPENLEIAAKPVKRIVEAVKAVEVEEEEEFDVVITKKGE